MEEKVKKIIEEIRPFIQSDGGDIEFIKIEDNKVYVKMLGACQGCGMAHITLKEGVEMAIKNEIPEIEEVVNVDNA